MISLCSVAKSYAGRQLFCDVSFSLAPGCFAALVGASGSGKTTLLQLIAGIDSPDRGAVLFEYNDLADFSYVQREAFWRDNIGLVLQEPSLIPELLVWENIALKGFAAGLSYEESFERAQKLAHYLGLESVLERLVYGLSGGEQQRVALARALFMMPKYLLADEPTSALDKSSSEQFLDLLERARCDYNLGIVVVSHDARVYNRALDHFVLQDQHVVEGLGGYCE